ncbi:MAG TPA: DUF6582 domain-containing protein [Acidimicrobiales bacterium]|nr:DUF6582 domain-containing protein [Acidimicrobiales bacterium]
MTVDERMLTALAMHDQLLLNRPDDAPHDESMCPFCADWAMAEEGVPCGYARIEMADAKKPYGDVEYADPGYQADKVKRYPIDTEAHARAAWSYIHQAGNAEKYSADQLSNIRQKIAAALKKFGVETENKEVEKTRKMADAKSGSNKPNSASKNKPSDSKASAEVQPVASEGGTPPVMETITHETHEALLEKALRDATASLESEKAELAAKVATLEEAASASAEEVASLKSENERLNGELDTAQVALKSAQDEAEALKSEKAAAEEAAAKAKVAEERAYQVRNLNLFTEEYVAEKASLWADMEEAAWTDRLEEWKAVKGQAASSTTSTDTASAMSGSSEIPAGKEPSARRRALGLVD